LERQAAKKQSNGSAKQVHDGQDLIWKATEADILSDVAGGSVHIRKTFNNLLRSQSMPYVEQETRLTETDIKAWNSI